MHEAMDILYECVSQPVFTDEDLAEQIETAEIELEQFFSKPDTLLREASIS